MANHKSAEKRIRSSKQRARKNKRLKSLVRDTGKKALEACSKAVKEGIKQGVKSGAKSAIQQALNAIFSKLDRAAKSGAIHKNKAKRDKARFARKFHKSAKSPVAGGAAAGGGAVSHGASASGGASSRAP